MRANPKRPTAGMAVRRRDVPHTGTADKEARKEIQELFVLSRGSLFYDEIAERLNLPLQQVVKICNILEREGLIGEEARTKAVR